MISDTTADTILKELWKWSQSWGVSSRGLETLLNILSKIEGNKSYKDSIKKLLKKMDYGSRGKWKTPDDTLGGVNGVDVTL